MEALSASISPIMSEVHFPHAENALKDDQSSTELQFSWTMQKTAPDLYADLPKILETLVDDVGTVCEKFTELLNDFEEFCNSKYKSGGPLKSEAAWVAYNDECINQY